VTGLRPDNFRRSLVARGPGLETSQVLVSFLLKEEEVVPAAATGHLRASCQLKEDVTVPMVAGVIAATSTSTIVTM
jgi:hypothetical protein